MKIRKNKLMKARVLNGWLNGYLEARKRHYFISMLSVPMLVKIAELYPEHFFHSPESYGIAHYIREVVASREAAAV